MREGRHFQEMSPIESVLCIVLALQHLQAQFDPMYGVIRIALGERYSGDLHHFKYWKLGLKD